MGRRRFLACACCGLGVGVAGAASAAAPPGLPEALELAMPAMTRLRENLWIAELAPGVWVHTVTHRLEDGTAYPANGLVVALEGGALLVDCWHDAQAEALLGWAAARGMPVTWSVSTHFHGDRVGGVGRLRALGVACYAHPLTCRLAQGAGNPVPAPLPGFTGAVFRLAPGVELRAPGAGHTRDNITVWLEKEAVLFGGCLVKSVTSPDLGYLADADVKSWPGAIRAVRDAYPGARHVVPGHGSAAGDGLAATLRLLKA